MARENQINLLLGRNPQPIPTGLPSQLLERRPDVREAEQLLVSANAEVGVATAAFFPTLRLTGLFGNVSPELGDLFSKGKTWEFGADLLGPLFQGGPLKRARRAAKARWEGARVQYEATVMRSFAETLTALTARTKLVETERQRARTVQAYQEAVRLATPPSSGWRRSIAISWWPW